MMAQLEFGFPPDEDTISTKVPALRFSQPIGDLYVAKFNHSLLSKITRFDVRRVLRDERDVEKYLGVQRPLNERRVREMAKYVNFIDATFPTSILLAVDPQFAMFDEASGELTLTNTPEGEDAPTTAFRNLCRVLDGQHRIAALDHFGGECFECLATVFVGSSLQDQAYVFSTVNFEQTKVNRSLVYDLHSVSITRSPFKTCHNITVALDNIEGGPFYKRIKRLGTATPGRTGETLTQATVVNGLMQYVSPDPKMDRDLLLRKKRIPRVEEPEVFKYVFRNAFIDDKDDVIFHVINNYFIAVSERWPDAWKYRGTGLILNRTNGYNGFIDAFGQIYCHLAYPGDEVGVDAFRAVLDAVELDDRDFNTNNFKPGSSGSTEIRNMILRAIE